MAYDLFIAAYKERISYDANGNILKYLRHGADDSPPPGGAGGGPLDMDSLGYKYNRDVNGNLVNNRLNHVRDAVNSSNYTVDIDDQSADNYTYDRIGNLKTDVAEKIGNINWTVYGKIKQVDKTEGSDINYGYDAGGNRTSKIVSGTADTTTFYIRDAQGNVLAIYSKKGTENLRWDEQHLYGSSRLGMWRWDTLVPTAAPVVGGATSIYDSLLLGSRAYELSNHLGNVLSTISDKKIGNDSSGVVNYYLAEVLSQNDYYPFGMMMPGRKYSAEGGYRYGFNGKENDNEVKGEGNSLDFGARIYDPRIGRFLSVDRLITKVPFYTPYLFAGDKPIVAIDANGDIEIIIHKWEITVDPETGKPGRPIYKGAAKIEVQTFEDVQRIWRTPAEVNVFFVNSAEKRVSGNTIHYDWATTLNAVEDVKNTGLDDNQELKRSDPANYWGKKAFGWITKPVGLLQLGEAMTGGDYETGRQISTSERWVKFASGLFNLVSLGRAGDKGTIATSWIKDKLIDQGAEEGIKYALEKLNINDKNKSMILVYHILRFMGNGEKLKELQDAIIKSASLGAKGAESFLLTMKNEFGINTDMPVDKNAALSQTIGSYLSQFNAEKEKKVVDNYNKKKK